MQHDTPRSQVFSGPEGAYDSFAAVGGENVFSRIFSKLSSAVGVPLGFFQSRPEIRTWGAQELQDPSVQPRPQGAPRDYGTPLPGYPKPSCSYFTNTIGSSSSPSKKADIRNPPQFVSLFNHLGIRDDALIGPRITTGPPMCNVEYPKIPADKLGEPTYDYRDLLGYRMDYHPYVNATMTAQDATRMHVHANWLLGYPYGVPAVEENEKWKPTPVVPNTRPSIFSCLGC